jgi:hypothetical protein
MPGVCLPSVSVLTRLLRLVTRPVVLINPFRLVSAAGSRGAGLAAFARH